MFDCRLGADLCIVMAVQLLLRSGRHDLRVIACQNSDSGSCDSSSSSSSEGSDIEVQQVVSGPTNPTTDAMTVAEHPIAEDVESSDGFD